MTIAKHILKVHEERLMAVTATGIEVKAPTLAKASME
jgi:hypothetical protein